MKLTGLSDDYAIFGFIFSLSNRIQTLIDKDNLSGLSVVQQNPVVQVSVRNVLEKGENIARLVALQAFLLKLGDHFKRTQSQTITAVGGHGIIYIRNGYD